MHHGGIFRVMTKGAFVAFDLIVDVESRFVIGEAGDGRGEIFDRGIIGFKRSCLFYRFARGDEISPLIAIPTEFLPQISVFGLKFQSFEKRSFCIEQSICLAMNSRHQQMRKRFFGFNSKGGVAMQASLLQFFVHFQSGLRHHGMHKPVFRVVRQQLRTEFENALPLLGFNKMGEHPLEFITEDFCVRRHRVEFWCWNAVLSRRIGAQKKRTTL